RPRHRSDRRRKTARTPPSARRRRAEKTPPRTAARDRSAIASRHWATMTWSHITADMGWKSGIPQFYPFYRGDLIGVKEIVNFAGQGGAYPLHGLQIRKACLGYAPRGSKMGQEGLLAPRADPRDLVQLAG